MSKSNQLPHSRIEPVLTEAPAEAALGDEAPGGLDAASPTDAVYRRIWGSDFLMAIFIAISFGISSGAIAGSIVVTHLDRAPIWRDRFALERVASMPDGARQAALACLGPLHHGGMISLRRLDGCVPD